MVGGPELKLTNFILFQMPFLELYHVKMYNMTSYVQYGWKNPPTALVIRLAIASQCFLLATD